MAELKRRKCPKCGNNSPCYRAHCSVCGFDFEMDKLYDKANTEIIESSIIEDARQEGAEDAIVKSGIMQLKIDSAVAVARQEEREACILDASAYSELHEDYKSEYESGQYMAGRAIARMIRKRGDK